MALGLSTRKSALAQVTETTEGDLKAPASTGDYTAIQPGFVMTPSFEELTSAENQSSIGQSKTVLGAENPEATFAHYLRGSGTEGVANDFSEMITAAMGSVEVNSTEYDTVASSTVSVVKVDAGEGVNFERGQGLLVKDGTNGYSIRNVLSVSTDDLNLGFNLANAPGTGVNLGKAIHYKPGDDTHPTLSLWHYIANGGNIEAMAGCRATQMSMTFEAGQLINTSFNFVGVAYYWNPIIIASTNRYLDINDGSDKTATVAIGVYKDPHDLAEALQTALNSVSSGFTVTYSDTTGKYTLVKASGTFNLEWNTGANTANTIGTTLGFLVAADDTGALTYTSDNAISVASPQTPAYDSASPLVAKYNEVLLGDATDITCFGAQTVTVTLTNDRQVIPDICEESGVAGAVFTGRSIEISVTALLKQYDSKKFHKFHVGTNTPFCYNAGEKSGGNWVAGKCMNIYSPTASITSYQVSDNNGLAVLEMTLRPYVDAGLGEFYINQL